MNRTASGKENRKGLKKGEEPIKEKNRLVEM